MGCHSEQYGQFVKNIKACHLQEVTCSHTYKEKIYIHSQKQKYI